MERAAVSPAEAWDAFFSDFYVRAYSDLADEDEWLHIARVWHRTERAMNAERVMVMKLGIQTPHLHIHLFPFDASATREEVFAAFAGDKRRDA